MPLTAAASRFRARGAACATALAGLFLPGAARAHPQWSAGVVTAGCLRGDDREAIRDVVFCGTARGDLLFGRSGTADFGFGPYLGIGTAAFDDVRLSGGVSGLLPVIEDFPLVASLGALLKDGTRAGIDASLFWGVRSYNFHSAYNFAGGVVLGAQRTFGEEAEHVVSLGLQIDGLVLALPVLLVQGLL